MSPVGLALLDGVQAMLSHDFIRHAFVAGTGIAVASGLIGYVIVLRNQVFAGEALSHVAFAGTLAAFAVGIEPLAGLFGSTLAAAFAVAALGGSARGRDVVIGVVLAWLLGLGVLFLSLYTTSRSAANGAVGVNVLFGSIYGLSTRQALVALGVGVAASVALLVVVRPLLFASVDADIAAARGIPVRGLSMVFLALVGITVAEAVQAVGALLAIGLMVTPAAAVHRICPRPLPALGLSALVAVLCLYSGLVLSYVFQRVPPSFMVVALAFAVYVVSAGVRRLDRFAVALRVAAGRSSSG